MIWDILNMFHPKVWIPSLLADACSIQEFKHDNQDKSSFRCFGKIRLWCVIEWYSASRTNYEPPLLPKKKLVDVRWKTTRVTFGVLALSFAACYNIMCIKQNAIDNASKFPLASNATEELFYVNDCLAEANSVEIATRTVEPFLMQFLLRKWTPVVWLALKPLR